MHNHAVRAEITNQHSKEISSKQERRLIRSIHEARAIARNWVGDANKKKQTIKVFIDGQLICNTELHKGESDERSVATVA
jgi:hypothetical protein